MESAFSSKFEESLNLCFTSMRRNIDRNLKCQIFLTLADLMVSDKEKAAAHREEIIGVIDLGFQGVVDLQNNNSTDDFEYAEQLKESVIDFYECVSASVIDVKSGCQLFREHYKKLVWFVVLTTKREFNPIVDYLKSCMFLLYDTANCYTNNDRNSATSREIRNELNRPELRDIMQTLRRYQTSNPDVAELLTYANRAPHTSA